MLFNTGAPNIRPFFTIFCRDITKGTISFIFQGYSFLQLKYIPDFSVREIKVLVY